MTLEQELEAATTLWHLCCRHENAANAALKEARWAVIDAETVLRMKTSVAEQTGDEVTRIKDEIRAAKNA